MKIAVIGSGISGLTCAWYLHKDHDVWLYEAKDYFGGHTATVDVDVAGRNYSVDTGFIVFNNRTYPNFENLLDQLGIGRRKTQMSFSVKNVSANLEYNGHNLNSLFAQRRNLFSLKFYKFLKEILRFNKLARLQISKPQEATKQAGTVYEFLEENNFCAYFCNNYILPMGAAIWSAPIEDFLKFPLESFLNFFANHGLLEIRNRPQWYVVPNGSRSYVDKVLNQFSGKKMLNMRVKKLNLQEDGGIELETRNGLELFDQVIFACHSNQAWEILQKSQLKNSDGVARYKPILGKIKYQSNDVVLHTDIGLLPSNRRAWASWNYSLPAINLGEKKPNVTYNMNILQGINAPETFCVTLNQTGEIDKEKILGEYKYSHPLFTSGSFEAQKKRSTINGLNNLWFCGAYWYNGFHEDGVLSALDVVKGISNKDYGIKSKP